jgi:hypothetical protein
MTNEQARGLELGLYLVKWTDGTTSLASVGQLSNGERWLAPCNWTGKSGAQIASRHHWDTVATVTHVLTQSQKAHIEKRSVSDWRITIEVLRPMVVNIDQVVTVEDPEEDSA